MLMNRIATTHAVSATPKPTIATTVSHPPRSAPGRAPSSLRPASSSRHLEEVVRPRGRLTSLTAQCVLRVGQCRAGDEQVVAAPLVVPQCGALLQVGDVLAAPMLVVLLDGLDQTVVRELVPDRTATRLGAQQVGADEGPEHGVVRAEVVVRAVDGLGAEALRGDQPLVHPVA